MSEPPIDLVIMLKIVEHISSRDTEGVDFGQATKIENHLASGASIGSLSCIDNHIEGGYASGDSYITCPAAAVGRESHATAQQFEQAWNQCSNSIDLKELAADFALIRAEIRRAADSTPEEGLALTQVAQAEVAANNKDGPKRYGSSRTGESLGA